MALFHRFSLHKKKMIDQSSMKLINDLIIVMYFFTISWDFHVHFLVNYSFNWSWPLVWSKLVIG